MPTLLTVKQFATKHGAFTEAALRMLIFNEHQNGLADAGAIIRISRRVLMDEDRFFDWVRAQNKKSA